jgi:MFS family permease
MQLINPLFPLFLSEIGAKEVQNAMVISTGSFAATLLMLPSGLLIDKVGKKILILLNAILSTISILLISFTESWQLVLPFYILYSMAGAFFMPARMALISENATSENLATLFGFMNLAMPITGIISPVLSGFLVENYSWGVVFLVASTINAVSILPAFLLKERKIKLEDEININPIEVKSIFDKTILPTLIKFFLHHFFLTTAVGGINMIIPLFLTKQYNLSPSTIGLFFTGASIVTLFTQPPSGRLADKIGKRKLIILSVILLPIFYYLWIPIDNWIILLAIHSIGFGLWSMTWPATLALLSESVPSNLRGAAFGVRMTGVRLGFTVGPMIGSYLYGSYLPTTPFLAATVLSIIGAAFALFFKEKNK